MTSKIQAKLNAADIISFDVFDTLLVRNVARPTDVFKIALENFNQFSGFYLSADFTAMRIKSEKAAYEVSLSAGHATLDDIYEQFGTHYGYDKQFCEALKKAEIATEREALRRNPQLKEIYDYAAAQRKKIVIVSDMYLPKKVIAEILNAAGYDNWDEILVSCHDKYSKHDGSAYAYLRQKYGDDKIVHIGDNQDSDIGWAKAYGLETIKIDQDLEVLSHETTKATQTARGGKLLEITNIAKQTVNDAQQSVVTGLISHKMVDPTMTELESIGYGALGPLLLGFVQWLHESAQRNDIEHLYFLARDGAIIQRAYQAYYGRQALDNDYIFASRRLYNFAKIVDQPLTEDDVDFLTASDSPLKVYQYYERFGISVTDKIVYQALAKTNLRADQLVDGGVLYQKLRASLVLASEAVLKKSREERDLLQAYLRSIGLGTKKRNAVVDIGWHGTLQRSLSELAGTKLKGFYFGIHEVKSSLKAGETMVGFTDERLAADAVFHRVVKMGVEVFEYLFANPDQESVTAIAKSSDSFKQVTHDVKKDEDTLAVDAALRAIQASAIDFVQDYREATKNWADSIKRLDRAVAFQETSLLIQEPSDQQAIVIGRVKHSFAEGLPPRYIGMPSHNAKYYRGGSSSLNGEYQKAYWKPGFRRNVSILRLDHFL